MELLIVIAIIGLLATLAFVVLSRSLREGRAAAERQTVISIRNAVESFKQDHGILPPLVDDTNPLDLNTRNPRVRDASFLQGSSQPNAQRYSIYSIPYYLLGMLGVQEDGVNGPGYTEPQADGTFSRRGREFGPRLDVSRDPARIKQNPAKPEEMAFVDRWGKAATSTLGWPAVNPIRYYAWKPFFGTGGLVQQYNVPRVVGDPNVDFALRDATYAIVSVGPDGLTDGRRPFPTTGQPVDARVDPAPLNTVVTADDIVEVGR